MFLEIFLLCLLLITLLVIKDRKPKNMPPGPAEIPFVTYQPIFKIKDYKGLEEKYGPVVSTRLGSKRTVLIFDNGIGREALASPDLADRPSQVVAMFSYWDSKEGGVVGNNGQSWHHDRRFVLRNLRDLGMGKSYLESALDFEAQLLVDELKKFGKEPVYFPSCIKTAVLNMIWQMVAGKRFEHNSAEVAAIYKHAKKFMHANSMMFFLILLFPGLKKILPDYVQKNVFNSHYLDNFFRELKIIVDKSIEENQNKIADLDDKIIDEVPENLILEYLKQMKINENKKETRFLKGSLVQIVADLFFTGSDTVTNMLRWTVHLLARHPALAERMQRQIGEHVPQGTLVAVSDKPKLPLVEAFVTEALRYGSLVIFNIKRTPNRDTKIAGYHIPKGTDVTVVNYRIHRNEEAWPEPNEFRPERFLTPDGQYKPPTDHFFAFGSGRRKCLGENLAKMEYFLFSAVLIQNFNVRVPEGVKIQDECEDIMRIRIPKNQKFIYEHRG